MKTLLLALVSIMLITGCSSKPEVITIDIDGSWSPIEEHPLDFKGIRSQLKSHLVMPNRTITVGCTLKHNANYVAAYKADEPSIESFFIKDNNGFVAESEYYRYDSEIINYTTEDHLNTSSGEKLVNVDYNINVGTNIVSVLKDVCSDKLKEYQFHYDIKKRRYKAHDTDDIWGTVYYSSESSYGRVKSKESITNLKIEVFHDHAVFHYTIPSSSHKLDVNILIDDIPVVSSQAVRVDYTTYKSNIPLRVLTEMKYAKELIVNYDTSDISHSINYQIQGFDRVLKEMDFN